MKFAIVAAMSILTLSSYASDLNRKEKELRLELLEKTLVDKQAQVDELRLRVEAFKELNKRSVTEKYEHANVRVQINSDPRVRGNGLTQIQEAYSNI